MSTQFGRTLVSSNSCVSATSFPSSPRRVSDEKPSLIRNRWRANSWRARIRTATQADRPALFVCPIHGASGVRAVWRSSLWQLLPIRPSPPLAGPAGPFLGPRRRNQAGRLVRQAPPLRRLQRVPPAPRPVPAPAARRVAQGPPGLGPPRVRPRVGCWADRAPRHAPVAARAADLRHGSAAAMGAIRSRRRARSAKLSSPIRSPFANWG